MFTIFSITEIPFVKTKFMGVEILNVLILELCTSIKTCFLAQICDDLLLEVIFRKKQGNITISDLY